jgi:hypothetical protein
MGKKNSKRSRVARRDRTASQETLANHAKRHVDCQRGWQRCGNKRETGE